MGTRSTVKFYCDKDKKEPILSVYQQYDGDIAGVGKDLVEFLLSKTVVNGYSMNMTMEDGFANGIDCLAAQYVAKFKTRIGGLYLTHKDNRQEYNYQVALIDEELIISVNDDFEGTPSEFLTFFNLS